MNYKWSYSKNASNPLLSACSQLQQSKLMALLVQFQFDSYSTWLMQLPTKKDYINCIERVVSIHMFSHLHFWQLEHTTKVLLSSQLIGGEFLISPLKQSYKSLKHFMVNFYFSIPHWFGSKPCLRNCDILYCLIFKWNSVLLNTFYNFSFIGLPIQH